MSKKKILVGITGSIGAITIPLYLFALKEQFSDIRLIMTECAQKFLPKDTMALVIPDIHTELFPVFEKETNHVQLAQWADLFIVIPATAHTLAQVAHGLAGNLLTLTILAHDKSVFFFPNMNRVMWNNRATQRNLELLIEYNHVIVNPIEKRGIEHSTGNVIVDGFLPSPIEVVEIVKEELERRSRIS